MEEEDWHESVWKLSCLIAAILGYGVYRILNAIGLQCHYSLAEIETNVGVVRIF